MFDLGASILQPAAGIPLGYRRGSDGYYYRFHSQKMNWNDAQNTCKREGGNLAIIWNEQTRDVVRGFMTEGWIGVSDQSQEGKWLTPLNTPIPYSSWGAGEPNNLGDEDCTVQYSNKLWNDASCTTKLPFICQFKAGMYVIKRCMIQNLLSLAQRLPLPYSPTLFLQPLTLPFITIIMS